MMFSRITRLAAALLLAFGPMAGQATAGPVGSPGLAQLDRGLDTVLASGKALRSTQVLTARDLEAPLPQGYGEAIYGAFSRETSAARIASESKGGKGDVNGLIAFEDLAVRHEKALEQEQREYDAYMAALSEGRIRIDPKVVAGWPARDQQAFKAFLSPRAVGAYPSLSRLSALPMTDDLAMAGMPFGAASEECRVAAPCIVPCRNQNWTACLACINRAVGAARTAWSQYQSCKAGAGKPRWVPLRVWQAGCLVKLVAVLA